MAKQFPVPSETYHGIYQLPNGKWSYQDNNVAMNPQQFDTEIEAAQAAVLPELSMQELCECSGLMPENVLGANGRCIKCGTDLT